jgi:hypothetical protein
MKLTLRGLGVSPMNQHQQPQNVTQEPATPIDDYFPVVPELAPVKPGEQK